MIFWVRVILGYRMILAIKAVVRLCHPKILFPKHMFEVLHCWEKLEALNTQQKLRDWATNLLKYKWKGEMGIVSLIVGKLKIFQESYSRRLEHTPGNPPLATMKGIPAYSPLARVKVCVPKACWNNLRNIHSTDRLFLYNQRYLCERSLPARKGYVTVPRKVYRGPIYETNPNNVFVQGNPLKLAHMFCKLSYNPHKRPYK